MWAQQHLSMSPHVLTDGVLEQPACALPHGPAQLPCGVPNPRLLSLEPSALDQQCPSPLPSGSCL